ncbi:MAG: MarR family transcriptional regulator [Gammaproteobacteria bacterium]|nr:MarR family transcriptional regulator [Gammaproteobacteria bacterium]
MNKQHINIGMENAERGFQRFADAWGRAEQGQINEAEVHLNFEDLSMLLSILTPRRLEALKTLRQQGPLSVRALSKSLKRDYKNVHTDIRALEDVGLLERTDEGTLQTPWDVIDAHVQLVA